MNEQELFELAKEAANELSYEWKIGNLHWIEAEDTNDGDAIFNDASVDEIAQRLMPFFKKALTSPKVPATVGLT